MPETFGLQEQFDNIEQQHEASTVGMWLFLATEVMFFGGMLTGYTMYRASYFPAFAEGSRHLSVISGAAMTVVLLLSSFTMALAVHFSRLGKTKLLVLCLVLTMVLGLGFLGFKAHEYYEHYQRHEVPGMGFQFEGPWARQVELFFSFYFVLTGFHALHMIIGIGILTVLAIAAPFGRFRPPNYKPVDIAGLYWHFVDIVWIFLYPLLYLIDVHR